MESKRRQKGLLYVGNMLVSTVCISHRIDTAPQSEHAAWLLRMPTSFNPAQTCTGRIQCAGYISCGMSRFFFGRPQDEPQCTYSSPCAAQVGCAIEDCTISAGAYVCTAVVDPTDRFCTTNPRDICPAGTTAANFPPDGKCAVSGGTAECVDNCDKLPACFPAHVTVLLPDGSSRRMDALATGDVVAVRAANGGVAYEPIYAW